MQLLGFYMVSYGFYMVFLWFLYGFPMVWWKFPEGNPTFFGSARQPPLGHCPGNRGYECLQAPYFAGAQLAHFAATEMQWNGGEPGDAHFLFNFVKHVN